MLHKYTLFPTVFLSAYTVIHLQHVLCVVQNLIKKASKSTILKFKNVHL